MLGSWWGNLSLRERLALILGGLAVLGTALFLYLEPVLRERTRLREELPQLRADLSWMRAHLGEVRRLRARNQPGAEGESTRLTPAAIEASVRDSGLGGALQNLEPVGPDRVRIRFREVPFPELMVWLGRLQQRGIEVAQARIRRSEEKAGQVRAELTLEAGGTG